MKKLIKSLFKLFLLLLLLLLFFIIALGVYNKIMLHKEKNDLKNYPGNMYNINGNTMHIYTEGDSNNTLVFMAGFGDTCPTYSFKSIYTKLSNKYKIAVIEKAGYGFSEERDDTRDIDLILEESRKLLKESGIEPPYILVPYSMSGIEALYWLQQYPEDVKGIISLEMALPQMYENKNNYSFIYDLGIKLGFARLPLLYDQLYDSVYTDEEWKLVKECWYKNAYNKTVKKEAMMIYSNAQKIDFNELDYSKFMLCFMNKDTAYYDDDWYKYTLELSKKFSSNSFKLLNSTHTRLIHDESENISNAIIDFLENS